MERERDLSPAPMQFRARLYAVGYAGHLLTVLFILGCLFEIVTHQYLGAVALITIVSAALMRLRARRMSFDETTFRYDGWFRSVEIPYSEIVSVKQADRIGYPAERLYGPFDMLITTRSGKKCISLLWFTGEARRQFYEKVEVVNKKHRQAGRCLRNKKSSS